MLFKLLGAPLTAPLHGFQFILEQIADMAERELYDEDRIREELLLLHLRRADGEISDEEYADQEAEILARLRVAREHHLGGADIGISMPSRSTIAGEDLDADASAGDVRLTRWEVEGWDVGDGGEC